jgi:hypothetical protein
MSICHSLIHAEEKEKEKQGLGIFQAVKSLTY